MVACLDCLVFQAPLVYQLTTIRSGLDNNRHAGNVDYQYTLGASLYYYSGWSGFPFFNLEVFGDRMVGTFGHSESSNSAIFWQAFLGETDLAMITGGTAARILEL